ncbi:MAG: ATP-binding cassette domain-containing protein [Alphaproteobacteria bacterium]
MAAAAAPAASPTGAAIAIVDAWKAFDGRPALAGAAFEAGYGEVHALLGENGAGKSTLMNLVCGLYAPDEGRIEIGGRPFAEPDPRAAARRGVGMVHQHFKLIPRFTAAENILVACGPALGLRNRREAAARLTETAATLGFAVDVATPVAALSTAERQRIEILRLLLLDARIPILDEPTAVLTDDEAEAVLRLMRRLAADGRAVVLITHRLREVQGHADRVTVMRAGRTVLAGAPCSAHDRASLAALMVGGGAAPADVLDVAAEDDRAGAAVAEAPARAVRLAARGLRVLRHDGGVAVDGIDIDLRAGEIVGIAGVGGNGQDALVEALYGLRPVAGGTLDLDGRPLAHAPIAARRAMGLRIVPADRNDFALIPGFRAYENLALTEVPAGGYGFWTGLRRGRMAAEAARAMAARAIVGGGPRTPSRLLSGGNAQKLLLARELAAHGAIAPNVLIAHSPTRGLDVAACAAVHQALFDLCAAGGACLLVSEDLDEVMAIADRIGVLSRGRLAGPYPRAEIGRGRIGDLMLGHA